MVKPHRFARKRKAVQGCDNECYGALVGAGIAPLDDCPVVPGAHGVLTPVLSIEPVPMEALLAPEPALPMSDDVSAMEVVVEAPGACAAFAWVEPQADVLVDAARAAPEHPNPSTRDAVINKRDILSS